MKINKRNQIINRSAENKRRLPVAEDPRPDIQKPHQSPQLQFHQSPDFHLPRLIPGDQHSLRQGKVARQAHRAGHLRQIRAFSENQLRGISRNLRNQHSEPTRTELHESQERTRVGTPDEVFFGGTFSGRLPTQGHRLLRGETAHRQSLQDQKELRRQGSADQGGNQTEAQLCGQDQDPDSIDKEGVGVKD